MAERVGLYGGSFDPIHLGHLIVARAVAEELDLERVIFLPSADPPHKQGQQLADAKHRAEMVALAIAGEARFEFDGFDMTRAGPTYTLDTVLHFRDRLGADVGLYWIIGADSLRELGSWHRVAELVEACTMVTAGRAGCEEGDLEGLRGRLSAEQIEKLRRGWVATPRIDISASDIRGRVQRGGSIRYLVPESVGAYILRHGLYGS